MENSQPWAAGPSEILKHGLDLLSNDSDTNRRLAMISIDNAVELMIKTYLGLPQRISGIKIPRKEFSEMTESFPKLLDGLEKYASEKIKGIDLGEIEWYHRLRNELYHQGNGLTVERNNVVVYSEIANVLFDNLFGFKLVSSKEDDNSALGEFMQVWIEFEKTVTDISFVFDEKSRRPLDAIKNLLNHNKIGQEEFLRLQKIRNARNEVVHGLHSFSDVISKGDIQFLKNITAVLQERVVGNE